MADLTPEALAAEWAQEAARVEEADPLRAAWLREHAAQLGRAHAALAAERDKAYRERAALVAFLAARYPAEIRDAGSEWPVVYVDTPAGQMSWHISRDDLQLFQHLEWSNRVAAAKWDGHTTEVKYERLAELTAGIAREALEGGQ